MNNEMQKQEIQQFYSQFLHFPRVKQQIDVLFKTYDEQDVYRILAEAMKIIKISIERNPTAVEISVLKGLRMVSGKLRKEKMEKEIKVMTVGISDTFTDQGPTLTIFGVLQDKPQKIYAFQFNNLTTESLPNIYPNIGLGDFLTLRCEFDASRVYQSAKPGGMIEYGSLDEYEKWVSSYVTEVSSLEISEALINFHEKKSQNIEDFKALSVTVSNNSQRPFVNSITEWRSITGYITKIRSKSKNSYIVILDDGLMTEPIEFVNRYSETGKDTLTFGPQIVCFLPKYVVERYNLSEGYATIVGQVRLDGFVNAFGVITYELL